MSLKIILTLSHVFSMAAQSHLFTMLYMFLSYSQQSKLLDCAMPPIIVLQLIDVELALSNYAMGDE